MLDPCSTEGCPNPARSDVGSGLCDTCTKQKQRNGKAVGATPRHASKWVRLHEAAVELRDADEEEDYERSKDRLRKAAHEYAPTHHGEIVREGMERAKAEGRLIHRPRVVTAAEAAQLVHEHGSPKKAAAAAGVTLRSFRRAIADAKRQGLFSVSAPVRSRRDAGPMHASVQ